MPDHVGMMGEQELLSAIGSVVGASAEPLEGKYRHTTQLHIHANYINNDLTCRHCPFSPSLIVDCQLPADPINVKLKKSVTNSAIPMVSPYCHITFIGD